MADLLTHVASSWLPGKALRDARLRAVLYVGVCLPDVLYKLAHYLLYASTWASEVSHAPLVVPVYGYALALLFEEAWRRRAFVALCAGAWLHIALDLGKNYLGDGVILWGFPFTLDRIELGLYRNEDMLSILPIATAFVLIVELAARALRRPPKPRNA